MGWLDDLAKWFKDAFLWLWHGFLDLIGALFGYIFHALGEGLIYVLTLIPTPDFLTNNSIGAMLGGAGPVIGWLGDAMHLHDAMLMIAAGYAFRLLRKLLTLGQW